MSWAEIREKSYLWTERANNKIEKLEDRIVVVVGGAEDYARDLEEFRSIYPYEDYYLAAVNDQLSNLEERVEFMFTLHPEKAKRWLEGRQQGNQDYLYIAQSGANYSHRIPDVAIPDARTGRGGSSGGYAASVLAMAGFSRIVLAGIPMKKTTHAFHLSTQKTPEWTDADKFEKGWINNEELLRPCLRSMSGWTREKFGYPDPQWLGVEKNE